MGAANAETLFGAGFDFIPDLINQDCNSDLTGDRINMKNWERAYLLLIQPSGTAGDDLVISPLQYTAASGGSSKALTFSKLWYKIGTMTAQGTWTAVELSSASSALDLVSVNGVDLATDTSPSVILCEFRADSLDFPGGYTFLGVTYEGDDIGNARVINSHWLLMGNRYPQSIPLSSLS